VVDAPGASGAAGPLPGSLAVPYPAGSPAGRTGSASASEKSTPSPGSLSTPSRRGCLVQKTFGNTAESNARRLLARIASGLHDEAKARQAIADLEASAARQREAGENPAEAESLAARIAAALADATAARPAAPRACASQPPSPCKGKGLSAAALEEWEYPEPSTDEEPALSRTSADAARQWQMPSTPDNECRIDDKCRIELSDLDAALLRAAAEAEAARRWRESGIVEISNLDEDRYTELPEKWAAAAQSWNQRL